MIPPVLEDDSFSSQLRHGVKRELGVTFVGSVRFGLHLPRVGIRT